MSASASILKAIDPRTTKLNLMLIAVPLTWYFAYSTAAFFASMVAIMPLAFLMGRATEEIALQTSDSLGGLLNATFGNAAELIIALFAIIAAYEGITSGTEIGLETSKTMVHLVQASLIGSILGNLLLVMGLAFVWGGIHYEEQSFSQTQVSANGSLLLLAVMVLVVPTVFHSAVGGSEGASGVENLSHIAVSFYWFCTFCSCCFNSRLIRIFSRLRVGMMRSRRRARKMR